MPARERGRRARARALHVARQRPRVRRPAARAHRRTTCSPRATPMSAGSPAAFIEDETSVLVGTRSFWQGIDAPGVVVRARRDRPHPVPVAGRSAARGPARPRDRARAERVRRRRPAGRRARARAGRGPADPHAQRPRRRRRARLAPRAQGLPPPAAHRDAAVPAQRRPRRGVRVPRRTRPRSVPASIAGVGAGAGRALAERTSSRSATRSPARSAAPRPANVATTTTASRWRSCTTRRIAAMPDA